MRKYILNEAALSIDDVYNKYYQSIDRDVFNAAVAADPTSYNQGKIVKVGNFVKWILKLYQNNSWKTGDSYETKDLLSKFIKYKSKLPIEKRDINRFNSIHNLYSIIQTLEGQGVKSQKDVKKEGADVVYEDDEWKIVIPHTEEASCIYGAQTRWCTAGREDNMFDYYNKQGPLYININKVTGEKYQFHFETNSYMDADDDEISPRRIGLSKGAIEYYKSIGKKAYIMYDKVDNFYDGFARVKLVGRGYNFINEQCELLWKEKKWFDGINHFHNGFAIVKLVGRGFNFINEQGELVWKEDKWFDKVHIFKNGFAEVYIESRGWNFINTQGELLWKEDKWFEANGSFYNGFAIVIYNGTQYNLNTNGELIDDNGNRVNIELQESKRRVIRLTESDIHKLVIKTLKEYLC